MWVVLILVLALAVIALHILIPKRYNWPSTLKKLRKIPGPRGVPYFGNSFSLLVSNEEFIPLLVRFSNQYGPIWKFSINGTPFVFLSDLDDIEVILNSKKHITKGIDYEFLVPWLGTGLLISTGKKWFDHRKWLTPAFHFTILEQYIDIMNKNANILCKLLETYPEGSHVEINPLICHCALDIICETAMGAQVNSQKGGEKEYVKAVVRMSQIFIERTLSPWIYRPWLFNLSPIGREHNRLLKIVHGFTEKIIEERLQVYRDKYRAEENNKLGNSDIGEKKKMSFLDLLIEMSETQNRLTKEEIREEVDTFMFEGHDTTATAISWTLLELGLHPDIQEKAYQEQCELLQQNKKELTLADLQEMKYLERVIKETLRLFPSVPIMSRVVEENIKIRDFEIPKDTQVPIFIYYIHRNPKIYPDPETFNPDRFLPDLQRDRHPYSYIPFSAGPRNCIGQKFAMMEEKIVLSHILRNFKITAVDKLENILVMGEVILRPKENLKIIFEKREKNKSNI